MDQGPNEERPDVLCYTSAPFTEPYTAIGAVGVTLFAASSAPDTDFVARLVDVHPDGRAIGVADGIIRASARESYPAPGTIAVVPPTPIEPDRVYEYSIDLWATARTAEIPQDMVEGTILHEYDHDVFDASDVGWHS